MKTKFAFKKHLLVKAWVKESIETDKQAFE